MDIVERKTTLSIPTFLKRSISRHFEIVEYLYANASIDDSVLEDAYLRAAGGGSLGTMKFLFNKGTNRPGLLEDALLRAAANGHQTVLTFLLEHGADQSVVDTRS